MMTHPVHGHSCELAWHCFSFANLLSLRIKCGEYHVRADIGRTALMSEVLGAQSETDAPPARNAWLESRISSLSQHTRQSWLQNAVRHTKLQGRDFPRYYHKHSLVAS